MAFATGRGGARGRSIGAVELALVFALVGSLLATTVPTFVRNVHASHFVEPVAGLQRLGAHALSYARGRPVGQAFPPSVALTPSAPPRGHCAADPPDIWEHPTWRALEFVPAPLGQPHCYSFGFDSTLAPSKSTFRAHAHGDLDGDGITSTFEVTGEDIDGDPRGPVLDPGMFVQDETE
jgi:hypothetical protein